MTWKHQPLQVAGPPPFGTAPSRSSCFRRLGLEVDVVKLWYDSYLSWSHNKKQHNCGLKTFLNGRGSLDVFTIFFTLKHFSFLNCFFWMQFLKASWVQFIAVPRGLVSNLWRGWAPEGGYSCFTEKENILTKMRGFSKWWICLELYRHIFWEGSESRQEKTKKHTVESWNFLWHTEQLNFPGVECTDMVSQRLILCALRTSLLPESACHAKEGGA